MHTDTLLPALKRFLSGSSRFFRPGNPFYKKIRPLDVIHHLAPVPTLFITGTADTIIYPWHSRKLFDHAREPKILKIIEHGAHAEELYTRHKYVFIEACTSWFNRCFANPSQRR
jgi:fermentation-respiration switch protein FrsA (DUF1100 family)